MRQRQDRVQIEVCPDGGMWRRRRVQRDEPRQARPPGGGVLDGRTPLVENPVRVERRDVSGYLSRGAAGVAFSGLGAPRW